MKVNIHFLGPVTVMGLVNTMSPTLTRMTVSPLGQEEYVQLEGRAHEVCTFILALEDRGYDIDFIVRS